MVARLVAALKFTCNAVDLIYASILQTFKRVAAGEQRLRNRLSGRIVHALRRNDDAIRCRCCKVEGTIRITGQRHWLGGAVRVLNFCGFRSRHIAHVWCFCLRSHCGEREAGEKHCE